MKVAIDGFYGLGLVQQAHDKSILFYNQEEFQKS